MGNFNIGRRPTIAEQTLTRQRPLQLRPVIEPAFFLMRPINSYLSLYLMNVYEIMFGEKTGLQDLFGCGFTGPILKIQSLIVLAQGSPHAVSDRCHARPYQQGTQGAFFRKKL